MLMSTVLRYELIHVFQKYFFLFQKNFLVHTFFFNEEKCTFYLVSLWDFNLINVFIPMLGVEPRASCMPKYSTTKLYFQVKFNFYSHDKISNNPEINYTRQLNIEINRLTA